MDVAVGQQKATPSNPKITEVPLLLILEGIEKPGNLGAILRSPMVLARRLITPLFVLDCYNPNAIRSSQDSYWPTSAHCRTRCPRPMAQGQNSDLRYHS